MDAFLSTKPSRTFDQNVNIPLKNTVLPEIRIKEVEKAKSNHKNIVKLVNHFF